MTGAGQRVASFIAKPFTDYIADDYASVVAVNLTGFFTLTQRAIAEMLKRSGGAYRAPGVIMFEVALP